MTKRQIIFGIMLQGAGAHMNSWRHPSQPGSMPALISISL